MGFVIHHFSRSLKIAMTSPSHSAAILERVAELQKHPDEDHRSLDSQIKSMKVFNQAFNGSEIHKKVEEALSSNQPQEIKPGSAGEYLYGCLHQHHNDSDLSPVCTPACLRGFKPNDFPGCDVLVYEFREGELTRVNAKGIRENDPAASSCYLFVDNINDNWKAAALKAGLYRFDLYARQKGTLGYRHAGRYDIRPSTPRQPPAFIRSTIHASSSDERKANFGEDEDKSRARQNNKPEGYSVPLDSYWFWILLGLLIIVIMIAIWLITSPGSSGTAIAISRSTTKGATRPNEISSVSHEKISLPPRDLDSRPDLSPDLGEGGDFILSPISTLNRL